MREAARPPVAPSEKVAPCPHPSLFPFPGFPHLCGPPQHLGLSTPCL